MKPFVSLVRHFRPWIALLTAVPAQASEAQLAPLFTEPSEQSASGKTVPDAHSAIALICRIAVVDLRDEVWPRDYAGSYFGDVIRLPADRPAWLRSLVSGLERRGIAVVIPAPGETLPTDAKPVSIALTLAWRDFYNADLNATVGIRLRSVGTARPFETYARGDGQRSMTMGSVGGRGTEAMNRAGAQALDKLSTRMRDWCKAS
jgi:hypothetical protein